MAYPSDEKNVAIHLHEMKRAAAVMGGNLVILAERRNERIESVVVSGAFASVSTTHVNDRFLVTRPFARSTAPLASSRSSTSPSPSSLTPAGSV